MVLWEHDRELNKIYFSLYESINICGTSTGLKVYKYKLFCLFLFLLPPGRVSSSFQRIECWFHISQVSADDAIPPPLLCPTSNNGGLYTGYMQRPRVVTHLLLCDLKFSEYQFPHL